MKNKLSQALEAARGSQIVRNAGWSFGGDLFYIFCQLAMFIMVTNTFPDSEYGTFAAVVALMLVVGPFSSAGAGYVLVERVVKRGEPLGPAIGRAWLTASVGGLLFVALLVVLRPLVLPQAPVLLLIEIGVAELVFNQLVQASRFIGQALEKLWLNAAIVTTAGVVRVVAAYLYLIRFDRPTLEGWGVLYANSILIGVMVGMVLIARLVGPSIRLLWPRRKELAEGTTFSINVSSAIIKADADKTLLGRFNQLDAAGDYASAYRILGLASLPNQALAEATYARFFNAGSVRNARKLAARLGLIAIVMNTLTGLFYIFAGPYLVKVLGDSYAEAADVLKWIAFVPLVSALQLFAGNALSGTGHHRIRLLQTLSSAVLNLSLNIALIPKYSWRGSAAATIVTELWLVALHWRTLNRLNREEEESAQNLAAIDKTIAVIEL